MPAITAINSDPLTVLPGTPEATSTPPPPTAEGTPQPALNWLLTWLVQAESLEVDAEEAPANALPPTPQPPQLHWLTLLPSVPAFDHLIAPVATGEPDAPVAVKDSDDGENDEESGDETQSFTVAPPLALVPTPPPDPTSSTKTTTNAGDRLPTGPQRQPELPPQDGAPIPPLPAKGDKGELIWAAEFVVEDKGPESVKAEKKGASAETILAVRRQTVTADESQLNDNGTGSDGQREQPEPSKAERREGGDKSRAVTDAAVPRKTAGATDAERAEHPTVSLQSGHTEGHRSVVVTQWDSKVDVRTPASPVANVESPLSAASADLDLARPLKPAQIATLNVDVPAQADSGSGGTLRLAISQRGENVNVRLRSWDSGVAPIDNNRMQPLLQSLADQGYSSVSKTGERSDDSALMAADHLREKPLATAEAAKSENDQNPSQGEGDRQRRNQERQQQFYYQRRQSQNPTAEAFEMMEHFESSEN